MTDNGSEAAAAVAANMGYTDLVCSSK